MCQHLHSRVLRFTCPPHLHSLTRASAKETAPSHKLKWSCPVRFSRECWGRPRGRVGCLGWRGGLGQCQEKRIYNLIICSGCLLKDRLCGIRFLTKECLRFPARALIPSGTLTVAISETISVCKLRQLSSHSLERILSWSQGVNPLWPHLLHFCWLALLPSLVQATLPPSFPLQPKSSHLIPRLRAFRGQTTLGGRFIECLQNCARQSQKLGPPSDLLGERILSRSENIFKGSISVTAEHQGQNGRYGLKPSQRSFQSLHILTKGLQLESSSGPSGV